MYFTFTHSCIHKSSNLALVIDDAKSIPSYNLPIKLGHAGLEELALFTNINYRVVCAFSTSYYLK